MSRQFDVYRNPLVSGRADRPYLVVVQHALFENRPTRVVAPLVVNSLLYPEARLNPELRVQNKSYYLSPTEVFTIPLKRLQAFVANLEADRDRIVAALDLVFTGV